jgi:hypothetical protein
MVVLAPVGASAVSDVQTCTIEHWLPEQIANGPKGSWRKQAAKLKAAKLMVWASLRQEGWHPVDGRASLEITLVFPANRRRDRDNLYARVKGCIDGCHEWIRDDSTEWLDLFVAAKVEKGRTATILRLSEA